jgi:tetratricopeptide (TPR) repeat protein
VSDFGEQQVMAAYKKAINMDKRLHGASIGDYAQQAYQELVFILENAGHLSDALKLLNEQIARESVRYGERDEMLSFCLTHKAELLERMKRFGEAKQVRGQISNLEKTAPGPKAYDFKSSIKSLQTQVNSSSDVSVKARKLKSIGDTLLGEVFPTEESVSRSLDGVAKGYLKESIKNYHQSIDSFQRVPGSKTELGELYGSLFTAHFSLGQFKEALHAARMQCKAAETALQPVSDSTVKAFADLARAMNQVGSSADEIRAVCRKAISIDKALHGTRIGVQSMPAYKFLAGSLAAHRDFNESLKVVNEEISRIKATFGKRSFHLSEPLSLRKDIFEKLNRPDGVKQTREEIEQLNDELSFAERF